MKYLTLAVSVMLAATVSAEHFKVIAPLSKDDDGAMARLVNFDTGVNIDSVLVADGVATFEGEVDEPLLANVTVDGNRMPVFILEPGTISFNAKEGAFGSMLNDQLRELGRELSAISRKFQTADESTGEALYRRYEAVLDSAMEANSDNPLGFYIFLNTDASQGSVADLRSTFAKYPDFSTYKRAKTMLDAAEKREATQPGNKYVDFSVSYGGNTTKLSDYVEKGKYTLVDFWASWCGPCMRQVPVLKKLYSQYHDKGLDIVGVAVWDKPDDTLAAIKSHGLSWPNIIDARTIPTDLYGINGIPCIMLIGPDGTILSRDKQGDELVAEVERYFK